MMLLIELSSLNGLSFVVTGVVLAQTIFALGSFLRITERNANVSGS